MCINKKRVLTPEEFVTYKKNTFDEAKKAIADDVDNIQKAGFKVKQIPVNFDNNVLVMETSPYVYEGIIGPLILWYLIKKRKKSLVRYEKLNDICAIELRIISKSAKGKKCIRIIRYFVFKHDQKKGKYIVRGCNNIAYNIYASLLIKKVKKHGTEYMFRKQFFEFLFRCCFPKRFGEQEFEFRGKNYKLANFVTCLLIELIIVIALLVWRALI